MVMIIITDAEGLAEMDETLVRRLIYYNDVYIFKIEDALHLLTRNRIFFKSVSKEEEIVDTLIDLFGRRKEVQ